MPAVTVDDILTLPRLAEPEAATGTERAVRSVTTAPSGFEGEGFPVRRAFAGIDLADLDPFIHMDQMGEVEYAPGEPKGTPWHPHRGFETVTYIMDGTFLHQDSHGGGGQISDGATQWMTAGSGILHIETPPESLVMSGGLFHGIQLWVNLPATQKWSSPQYQSLEGPDVTLVSSADGGALIRVIAGELGGHQGPGSTKSPITMLHLTIEPGAQVRLPWPTAFNGLVYGLSGAGTVGPDRRPIQTGQLAVTAPGDVLTLGGSPSPDQRTEAFDVLILGGQKIGEPVAWQGPFVMNTKAELMQAFQDYEAGKLGVIPAGALGIT
jgi:redox-sensitive bicupin YhaK (pirin superfamily)